MTDNKTVWSFSRASCYQNCPKCYELCYIRQGDEKIVKKSNAFAEWGSLVHKCLELYFTDKLTLFDISDYYRDKYSEFVQSDFPFNNYANLSEKYMDAGLDFLDNFNGFDSDKYKIIGVEQEFCIEIDGHLLKGYIDLVIEDVESGDVIIVDHKSASELRGDKLESYLYQLYLYSAYIKQIKGCFPKMLVFNLFRAGKVIKEEFNMTKYLDAVSWLNNTILAAEQDSHYIDKITTDYERKGVSLAGFKRNDFYCNNLCSARAYCKQSKEYEGDDYDWLSTET